MNKNIGIKKKQVKKTGSGKNHLTAGFSREKIISSIVKEQKEKTKPDEKTAEQVNQFVDLLNKELKKRKIDANASVGGSVAKGTFIKDSFDADIFIKFSTKYRGKNISDILGSLLKEIKLAANRVHGSRDYFQIKREFTYELVPVLNVNDYREAENVADMSPLHVHYFIKKSKRIKHLRDEVRISKLFMKSSRVYGAESYIKGFSGHVVDLLLIKYKTFIYLLSAAAKWKNEEIIDLEKYHIDPKMSLNNSKISGPLIIVDPIQKNRNAAAAVSRECFERFKERCREFLKNPSGNFFRMPDFSEIIDEKIAHTKKAEIFILNIVPFEGKRDVVGSKILKIKEHIEAESKKCEFTILWSDWEMNEKNSRICIAFEDKTLSEKKVLQGPPENMKEALNKFSKAHKKTFIKDKIIFAEEKREFVRPLPFLKHEIKSRYVKEKCKSVQIVKVQKT